METRNPYVILGVNPTASPEEILDAFTRGPGADDPWSLLDYRWAWQQLSDDALRRKWQASVLDADEWAKLFQSRLDFYRTFAFDEERK